MAIITDIEYCDSSNNLMMGCNGCELWNPKTGKKDCYAGVMTERWGGPKAKGWPVSFDQPKIFMERLKPMLDWPDLTGTERPDKPWLNGYPRIVFLDDMGDSFTKSLPLDWLAPAIGPMAQSPHIYFLLTKNPGRMGEFWQQYGAVPPNFWLATTVTSQATIGRIPDLLSIPGASVYALSAEPLWGPLDFRRDRVFPSRLFGKCGSAKGLCEDNSCRTAINWIIGGGQSGREPVPMHTDWARGLRDACEDAGIPFFFKQWGEYRPYTGLDHIIAKSQKPIFIGPKGQRATHREGVQWPEKYGKAAGWELMTRVGKKKAGRLLDGREWNGMPPAPVRQAA